MDWRLHLCRFLVACSRWSSCGNGSALSAALGSPSGSRLVVFSSRWLRCSRCTIPFRASSRGSFSARSPSAGWLDGGPGRGPAAGALYAGALVASVTLLRISPSYGLAAILWVFAVVWGADVAAYFAGRTIGGPRLWPSVSPGKTWSGAIVGALAGAVLGLMLTAWTNRLIAAVLARTCDGDRVGAWRFVRIRAQATFRRQRFERPDPRPWRIDGSA